MVEKVRGLEIEQEVVEVDKEVAEVAKKVLKVAKGATEIAEQTMNNGRVGCSYKEFMACNPEDYDGKGGAIVYTRWIEKMESVQDMSRLEVEKPQLAWPRKSLRCCKERNYVQTMRCKSWKLSFDATPWLELAMPRTLIDSISLLG
ncbi:hypothetical protein Tco_1038356 [Tanacetum coccineum]